MPVGGFGSDLQRLVERQCNFATSGEREMTALWCLLLVMGAESLILEPSARFSRRPSATSATLDPESAPQVVVMVNGLPGAMG